LADNTYRGVYDKSKHLKQQQIKGGVSHPYCTTDKL